MKIIKHYIFTVLCNKDNNYRAKMFAITKKKVKVV